MINIASYNNFQSENTKYSTKESRNNYNPEFNNAVESKGEEEELKLKSNIDKYAEFISWARWYPDLFLDLIKPKEGGIKLHSDQRTFMRVAMRFLSLYGVYPRGWGKTFNEEILMFVSCVLYPGIEFALTAQTKENAAELLKDKYSDILKKYPWFKNEIYDAKFSKNDAEIKFINNSKIDVLANSQTSKGQRRHIIMIEESALLDDFTFQDALFPIVEHGRMTIGKLAIMNPEELNQKVSFFTTAGFRGSDEFERSLRMKDDMINLQGKMILGSDWHLGCWYGRGSTKKQILDKKKNMSPIAFAQNYESKWCGASADALVDINKLMSLRTLIKPELQSDGKSEYYCCMDVSRSNKTSNNQSSIVIIKVKRNSEERIVKYQLINLINLPNGLNFTGQAIEFKRIKKLYQCKMAIIDENGLGKGLLDELLKEQLDPISGDVLPCWNTINTDDQPDLKDAEKCLYALHSQGINSDIIVNMMNMVDSEKLQLLEKNSNKVYSLDDKDYIKNIILPHIQTDLLIEEIANLKVKHLPGGKLTIEQLTRKVDKDRYSATAYCLWYIKTFEDRVVVKKKDWSQAPQCVSSVSY